MKIDDAIDFPLQESIEFEKKSTALKLVMQGKNKFNYFVLGKNKEKLTSLLRLLNSNKKQN